MQALGGIQPGPDSVDGAAIKVGAVTTPKIANGTIIDEDVAGSAAIAFSKLAPLITGSIPFADGAGALAQDNANLFWDDVNNRLGLGTSTPNAPVDITGDSPGTVGGFFSGALHVTSPSALVNANAVITGHNSFGGNKQLWYLGSTSSSNDNIGVINRQNADLGFFTNNIQRLLITSDGSMGVGGGPAASALLDLISTSKGFLPPKMTTVQRDAIVSPATGLLIDNTTTNTLNRYNGTSWEVLTSGGSVADQIDWDSDPASAPTEITIGRQKLWELPDAAERSVLGSIKLPDNIDLSAVNPTIAISFDVSVVGAANADVRLELEAIYIGVGDLADKIADETLLQTKAVINTLNRHHQASFTLDKTKMASGERAIFRLRRLGIDAADTFTGRIGLEKTARMSMEVTL